jgi:hypothetical protein
MIVPWWTFHVHFKSGLEKGKGKWDSMQMCESETKKKATMTWKN